jgi:CO/xanthine dehydrogenase Mo-binding subunit
LAAALAAVVEAEEEAGQAVTAVGVDLEALAVGIAAAAAQAAAGKKINKKGPVHHPGPFCSNSFFI